MNLLLLSTIASSVACAPLLISALSPKFSSVQNIQGSNYSGAIPPPWITGFYGSPYRPYGGYGQGQVAPPPPPPPPQVNPGQNIPPNSGLGQQPNEPNPVGGQGALPPSGSNGKGSDSPVNDSATYGDNGPPPTFQFDS